MIKATIVCTNCNEEKDIPREELLSAVRNDDKGELSLCGDCEKLWENAIAELREERGRRFTQLQRQFGILDI